MSTSRPFLINFCIGTFFTSYWYKNALFNFVHYHLNRSVYPDPVLQVKYLRLAIAFLPFTLTPYKLWILHWTTWYSNTIFLHHFWSTIHKCQYLYPTTNLQIYYGHDDSFNAALYIFQRTSFITGYFIAEYSGHIFIRINTYSTASSVCLLLIIFVVGHLICLNILKTNTCSFAFFLFFKLSKIILNSNLIKCFIGSQHLSRNVLPYPLPGVWNLLYSFMEGS